MSHRDRPFGLDEIQVIAVNVFTDELSRQSSKPYISGRGVAMAAASSRYQCHHCKESGHFQDECPKLSQQKPPNERRGKWKPGNRGGGGGGTKWCSLLKTRNHSDVEFHKQQEEMNQKPAIQANFAHPCSVHLPTDPSPSPSSSFGFSFATTGSEAAAPMALAAPAAPADPALDWASATASYTASSIQIGPSAAERRQDQASSFGLFGAFGATYMVTSTTLQCATRSLSESSIVMLVDSGSLDNFVDAFLIPDWQNRIRDYMVLEEPHTIYRAGGHRLQGVVTGTIYGTVADVHDCRIAIHFNAFVVPGLGRHLFSVPASLKKGMVTIVDKVQPRLEVGNVVVPLQKPSQDDALYSFALYLAGEGDTAGVVLRVESADLSHRRAGHINSRSLGVRRKIEGNGVGYDGEPRKCDVCAIGKSVRQAHPKRAFYDASRPSSWIPHIMPDE